MSARLANTSVHRRCAGLCSIYANAHAERWLGRRRGAASNVRLQSARGLLALETRAPTDQVDRAILRLLLDDRTPGGFPVVALGEALGTAGLDEVVAALNRLRAQGVLEIGASCVELSTCARRIAELASRDI